jgi:hypothetical protein
VQTSRALLGVSALLALGAFVLLEGSAQAKPMLDPLLEGTHQSQSRLMKIPKVRRVARTARKSHSMASQGTLRVHSPACTEPPAVPPSSVADLGGLGLPEIDELEIEAVLPDLAADDSSKRSLLKPVRLVVLRAPLMPEVGAQPLILAHVDRPVPLRVLRARMLPKLCDSGDDASLT